MIRSLFLLLLIATSVRADEREEKRKELETIRLEMGKTTVQKAQIEGEIAAIGQDRAKIVAASIEAGDKIRGFETRIANAELRLLTLETNASALKQTLAKKRDTMVDILAVLQRMNKKTPPAILSHPDDALLALRSSLLLSSLLPDMRREAELIIADLEALAKVKREIDLETRLWREDIDKFNEARVRLEALALAKSKIIESTEQRLTAEKLRATGLELKAQSLEALLFRLEQPLTAAPTDKKAQLAALQNLGRLSPAVPFNELQGKIKLPVNGTKLRDFGAHEAGQLEKGMSFITQPQALVTAPTDSSVVYAGPFRSYGQLLILNAGAGYHLVLAGMEKITVEVGQFVLANEPIAIMGATNALTSFSAFKSSQPVLYIEFKKDGQSINPAPFFTVQTKAKT